MIPRKALLAVYCAALVSGCGKSETVRDDARFKAVQEVFTENCVSCHNSAQALSGLNLEEGFTQAALVSVKAHESAALLVDPGNPDKSYLYLKITGRQFEVGGQGDQMPAGNVPLPGDKVALIRDWIVSGAGGATP